MAAVLGLVLTGARPAYADGIYGNWSFNDLLPGLFAQATDAYNTLGPLAWVLYGMAIGAFALTTLIGLVRYAVRRGDGED